MQRYSVRNNDKSSSLFPFIGYQIAVVILLFMMSMNVVNRFFYLAFFAAMVCIIMQRNALRVSGTLIPTICFSISLCAFSPSTGGSVLGFIKQFTYPLCTLIGYNLVSSNRSNVAEKQAVGLTVALASGACGHYFLNMLRNWGGAASRNTIDFWTNTVIAATGQAALACMMVAVAAGFLFSDASRQIKLCMLAIMVGIVYYNLMLAGRTLFILLAVALLIGFISRLVTLRNSFKRLKLFATVMVICLLVIVIFSTNVFGVQDTIIESNFYSRFFAKNAGEEIEDDGRFEKKIEYIRRMDEHLWGGKNIHAEIGSAHDIIFDTYDDSGIFALIFILIILSDMIRKCLAICKSKKIADQTKIMIACVMTVIMLEFMVEPILAGMPWLLASYCAMYGAYSRLMELI